MMNHSRNGIPQRSLDIYLRLDHLDDWISTNFMALKMIFVANAFVGITLKDVIFSALLIDAYIEGNIFAKTFE